MENSPTIPTPLIVILSSQLKSGALSEQDVIGMLDRWNTTESRDIAALLSELSPEWLAYTLESLVAQDDSSIGGGMIRTVWILLSISTFVLLARLFVKWRSFRRFFWDDIAMTFSLFFGYTHAALVTVSWYNGLGRHLIFLTNRERVNALRIGYFALGWGYLSPMAGRLGFCVFLLCLASTDSSIKRWPIYIFMVFQVLINVGAVIVMYSQCGTHLSVMWDNWAEYELRCWSPLVQRDYGYLMGSYNALTDVFLALLPAVMILHTSMPLRQKLGIAALLCLSILAMVASIVKTIESKALDELVDYTYDMVPFIIWNSIELNVVMTIASIPLLRPLFQSLIYRIAGSLAKHGTVQEKIDSISMGSIIPKTARSNNIPTSSSEEHIAPQQDPFAITREVEVIVSSTSISDIALVHASLVGLVADDSQVANIWH